MGDLGEYLGSGFRFLECMDDEADEITPILSAIIVSARNK